MLLLSPSLTAAFVTTTLSTFADLPVNMMNPAHALGAVNDHQASAMQGKTADEQRHAVIAGFPAVPSWFRRVFPYSKWGAELNAKITPAFFTWLVGPMETTDVEIGGAKQKSGVHIKKCRQGITLTGECLELALCKSNAQRRVVIAQCQCYHVHSSRGRLVMQPHSTTCHALYQGSAHVCG